MRRPLPLAGGWALAVFLLCGVVSCQPAHHYDPQRPGRGLPGEAVPPTSKPETAPPTPTSPGDSSKKPAPPEPLPPDYAWKEPENEPPQVPLEFISSDREEWGKLTQFWTEVLAPNPGQMLPPLGTVPTIGPLAIPVKVQIKVPLGLDDPTPRLPPSNPPTVARWRLGKQLFFDDGWLAANTRLACAHCHIPAQGFTGGTDASVRINGMDTPTLVNTVYSTHLFWDGRAAALEEVVQRSLEDEREPGGSSLDHPHTWSGVVRRLRSHADYPNRFREAFGTPPTQDAVGKALATYLRTILSGNAVHDQARHAQSERSGATLEAKDYQKALEQPGVLAVLDRESAPREQTAGELFHGQELFYGKARCVLCHGGRNFTDNGFHNLGVGLLPESPGVGRFAVLPAGRKDFRMIGAFKTPTLRDLLRTAPYFHDGSSDTLKRVVEWHVRDGKPNRYLDPQMRDEKNPGQWRKLDVSDDDIKALVLFLRALHGASQPATVTEPQKQ
jgi:cytochrome c peroxidase